MIWQPSQNAWVFKGESVVKSGLHRHPRFPKRKLNLWLLADMRCAFTVMLGPPAISLWIRISGENAEKVRRTLRNFGAPMVDLIHEDLLKAGMVVRMGVVLNHIDIINKIDGVEFDEAWKKHNSIELQGLLVPIIGKAQLLTNKKATSRSKDRKRRVTRHDPTQNL